MDPSARFCLLLFIVCVGLACPQISAQQKLKPVSSPPAEEEKTQDGASSAEQAQKPESPPQPRTETVIKGQSIKDAPDVVLMPSTPRSLMPSPGDLKNLARVDARVMNMEDGFRELRWPGQPSARTGGPRGLPK